MTEVVREGTVPMIFEKEVTCAKFDEHDKMGCGAVLKVRETDLALRYWFGTHFKHYYAVVKCLCCGKYTKVEVPGPVFDRVYAANRKKATFDGFDDQ